MLKEDPNIPKIHGHGRIFCSCGKILSNCLCHTNYGIKMKACDDCNPPPASSSNTQLQVVDKPHVKSKKKTVPKARRARHRQQTPAFKPPMTEEELKFALRAAKERAERARLKDAEEQKNER